MNPKKQIGRENTLFSQRASNIILVVIFALILLALFVLNGKSFASLLSTAAESQITQQALSKLESDYQQSIKFRTGFINLYGLTLRTLNTRLVGNFSFVKDDIDILQCPSSNVGSKRIMSAMKQLKKYADNTGTPLVYMAIPDKTRFLPMAEDKNISFVGQLSSSIVGDLETNGVDCLNFNDYIGVDADAPDYESFYFRTDGHCTTNGEFWMAEKLAQHLKNKYELTLFNENSVFDLNNYSVKSHAFVGNYARSSGEFFTKQDVFEIYIPKFATDYTLSGISSKNKPLERNGSFEEVILNGYDDLEENEKYVYWVTDYGQFRSPRYVYVNNNAPESAPHILIISDSVFMRGFCYLAGACRQITVLDPRFFNNTDYCAQELATEKFDAIVVVGLSDAFYKSKYTVEFKLPDLPEKAMISKEEYGKSVSNHGLCLDSCNDVLLKGSRTIEIAPTAEKISLYGWAADFWADEPLTALYLVVGNHVLKCDYGIKRSGMLDYYGKESLLNCGFRITFPTILLKNGEVNKISFVGISADNSARYTPVSYKLALS